MFDSMNYVRFGRLHVIFDSMSYVCFDQHQCLYIAVSACMKQYDMFWQASMLSVADGPFINLARLNLAKYAAKPNLSKALFEYIFHHENDVRNVSKQTCVKQIFSCISAMFFLNNVSN